MRWPLKRCRRWRAIQTIPGCRYRRPKPFSQSQTLPLVDRNPQCFGRISRYHQTPGPQNSKTEIRNSKQTRNPNSKTFKSAWSASRHCHPIRCVCNMWSAVATPKAFGRHRFKGSQSGTRSQSAVAAPLCRRTPYGGSIKVHSSAWPSRFLSSLSCYVSNLFRISGFEFRISEEVRGGTDHMHPDASDFRS
jgi:hypothetical protein